MKKAGNSTNVFDWKGGNQMNIFKRLGEGLYFANFTSEECKTIINVLQCSNTLAFGERGEFYTSEDGTIYSFDSKETKLVIIENDGILQYNISIISEGKTINVFTAFAEPIRPEFYDYVVWEFHDGWWTKELEKLVSDDEEVQERLMAFLPLSELHL